MIRILLPLLYSVFLLTGCGLSDKERQDVAAVTCSIMAETRNMDAAIRVEKINEARKELSEDPFLDGDDGIKEAFKWGLCESLVLNDPTYSQQVKRLKGELAAKLEEQERIRKEREAEEERIRKEREAEEERIRKEQAARRAEEAAKQAELKRIAEEQLRKELADFCPKTKEDENRMVRQALDKGDTETYRKLSHCKKLNL